MNKIFRIDNRWFFTELPFIFKLFLFFIRGDLLVLLPLLLLIIFLYFISFKFMLIMIGVYTAVRNFGEMIYWFGQQFYERKYRPYDFGLKHLDNHAVYIIMQTLAVAGTVLGLGIVLYSFIYLK